MLQSAFRRNTGLSSYAHDGLNRLISDVPCTESVTLRPHYEPMKRLHWLVMFLCLILGTTQAWADETTFTFTAKSWTAIASTGWTGTSNWTGTSDGNQLTSGQGVQVTTGVSGVKVTSPASFSNVSKIIVKYCTNASKGAGAIKVKVGSGTQKSFPVSKPSSGGTTLKNATFNFSPNETGSIELEVTCSTNSIYINAITVTYTPASTKTNLDHLAWTYTPQQNAAPDYTVSAYAWGYTASAALGTDNGTYTYTIKSKPTGSSVTNSAIAVDGDDCHQITFTPDVIGTYTITVSRAEDATYNAKTQDLNIVVSGWTPTYSTSQNQFSGVVGTTYNVLSQTSFTTPSGGTVSYSFSNSSALTSTSGASLSGANFTATAADTYTVYIRVAQSGIYTAQAFPIQITICSTLATPTGLAYNNLTATSVDLSWDEVANASSYFVVWTDASNNPVGEQDVGNNTSYNLTGLTPASEYLWAVRAVGNGTTYCDSEESTSVYFITPSASCDWTINYQATEGAATWSENNCFTQSGTSSMWTLANFTQPNSACQFWVGPGAFASSPGHSVVATVDNIKLAYPDASSSNSGFAAPEGTTGTLRIYDNSPEANYYCALVPDAFQLTYGTEGSLTPWTNIAFERVGSTNVYQTALVDVPAGYFANGNLKYYVGTRLSNGTTGFISGKSSTLALNTMGGLTGTNLEGTKGVFRFDCTYADNNFYIQFIPYYRIELYDAEGVLFGTPSDYYPEAATNLSYRLPAVQNSPAKAKEGNYQYDFVGWNTTPGLYGESNVLTVSGVSLKNGDVYLINQSTSTNLFPTGAKLYPVYNKKLNLTYDKQGGTFTACTDASSGGYKVVGSQYTICSNSITKAGSTFTGWLYSGDGQVHQGGDVITIADDGNAQTLTAQWTVKSVNVKLYDKGTKVHDANHDYGTSWSTILTGIAPTTDCPGMAFLGWSTENPTSPTASAPTMKTTSGTLADETDITLYAIYTVADECGAWTLVTDAEQLQAGKQVIIAAKESDVAISTTQNTSNRGTASITKSGSNLSAVSNDVQIFELIASTAENCSGTWCFSTGTGLLQNNGDKKLTTTANTTPIANASFTISVTAQGVATVTSKSANAQSIKKNSTSALFSCYSTDQDDISLYIAGVSTQYTSRPSCSTLSSISAANEHRIFTEGDAFTPETITRHYADNSTSVIPSCVTVSYTLDGNAVAAGDELTYNGSYPTDQTHTIVASYGGKTVSYTITVTPLARYTVTFDTGAGGQTVAPITETANGAGITLPNVTSMPCADYTFEGWLATTVDTPTDEEPNDILSAGDTYNPDANITLHALYSQEDDAVENWTQFTNPSEIVNNGEYLLAFKNSSNYYFFTGSDKYVHGVTSMLTELNELPSSENYSAVPVKFVEDAEHENAWFMMSGTDYLGCTNTNDGFTVGTTNKGSWVVSYNTRWIIKYQSLTRYLRGQGTADFRVYNSESTNLDIYLYMKSAGVSYTTTPICATLTAISVENTTATEDDTFTFPATVTRHYDNGTTNTMQGSAAAITYSISGNNVTEGDPLPAYTATYPDTQDITVTVNYGGKTTTYTITMSPKNRYTVTYYNNGYYYGEETVRDGDNAKGVAAPATTCKYDGTNLYTFNGWSSTQGSGTTTASGTLNPVDLTQTPITANTTLHAIWQGAKASETVEWNLVTSSSTALAVDDEVIIADKENAKALNAYTTGASDNLPESAVTLNAEKDKITATQNATIWTLVAGNAVGRFAFRYQSGGSTFMIHCKSTASSASYNLDSNQGTVDASTSWSISINANGIADILDNVRADRYIRHNTSSNFWRQYASTSGTIKPSLFRKTSIAIYALTTSICDEATDKSANVLWSATGLALEGQGSVRSIFGADYELSANTTAGTQVLTPTTLTKGNVLRWSDANGKYKAVVPAIISANATAVSSDAETDIVILPGAKLTLTSGTVNARNVYIYRHGDHSGALDVNGATLNVSGTSNLVLTIDPARYYFFGTPYAAPLNTLRYLNGDDIADDYLAASASNNWLVVQNYNGAKRASEGSSENNWQGIKRPQYDTATLEANTGHAIGVDIVGGTASTQRSYVLPFTIADKANTVSVIAHPADNALDEGWNMLCNPYLHNITTTNMSLASNPLLYIVLPYKGTDERFQQYLAAEGKILEPFDVFFVQVRGTSDGILNLGGNGGRAATPHLSQKGEVARSAGGVTAESSNSVRAATPHLSQKGEVARSAGGVTRSTHFLRLHITAPDADTDFTTLIVGNDFAANDIVAGEDQGKFGSGDYIQLYAIEQGQRLAFDAINATDAAAGTSLGYHAPEAGEYTINFEELTGNTSALEHIWLTDNVESITTDLLTGNYTLTTASGTYNGRLTVKVQWRQNSGTVTALDDITGDDYDIRVENGRVIVMSNEQGVRSKDIRLFDAAGRLVSYEQGAKIKQQGPRTWTSPVLPQGVYMLRIGSATKKIVL